MMTYERSSILIAAASAFFSMVSVAVAAMQLRDAVHIIRTQQAVTLLDDAVRIGTEIEKSSTLLDVLVNNSENATKRRELAERLEPYQLLIFKASVYRDKGLVDPQFHEVFVADFCSLLKYKYFMAWWEEKKALEPYRRLSASYRSFSDGCMKRGG